MRSVWGLWGVCGLSKGSIVQCQVRYPLGYRVVVGGRCAVGYVLRSLGRILVVVHLIGWNRGGRGGR